MFFSLLLSLLAALLLGGMSSLIYAQPSVPPPTPPVQSYEEGIYAELVALRAEMNWFYEDYRAFFGIPSGVGRFMGELPEGCNYWEQMSAVSGTVSGEVPAEAVFALIYVLSFLTGCLLARIFTGAIKI
jgi:hypothetical protein